MGEDEDAKIAIEQSEDEDVKIAIERLNKWVNELQTRVVMLENDMADAQRWLEFLHERLQEVGERVKRGAVSK